MGWLAGILYEVHYHSSRLALLDVQAVPAVRLVCDSS